MTNGIPMLGIERDLHHRPVIQATREARTNSGLDSVVWYRFQCGCNETFEIMSWRGSAALNSKGNFVPQKMIVARVDSINCTG